MKKYNYNLSEAAEKIEKVGFNKNAVSLFKYIKGSRKLIAGATFFLLLSSVTTIITPFLIGDATNKYIPSGDKDNLLKSVLIIGIVYIVGAVASYIEIRWMGKVGQEILFRVRNTIFAKVQSLPLEFFNTNRSGDLISRINNDTDKLNQGFSETLLRFSGDIVVILGVGIVMLVLNFQLGLIAWASLGVMLIITAILSKWIKIKNEKALQRLGELSAQIQESLSNFKITFVFNRRDYFKESFEKVNENNRKAATTAGIANGLLAPTYNYVGLIGSLLILVFGIQILIFDKVAARQLPEFGTLLSFILYSSTFFNPLKEMGELFSQIQTSIASWSRINRLLHLQNNLDVIESDEKDDSELVIKTEDVNFGYVSEKMILHNVNLELHQGKTYALVGPTGGGKSTVASLLARLYDVSSGKIFFRGKDIRSYRPEELSKQIGVILQEPFMFTGSLAENIKYGNEDIADMTNEELLAKLESLGLGKILERFNDGLDTDINAGSENISLGQKQLIAFVRILLRSPKLLILDEATANIDTVTEKLLEEILAKLPEDTTKVIIAHRLNTIENADEIFFISGGNVEKPLNFDSALNLINNSQGKS